jgi:DUF4097 and DUF4098 domain-containing protein YvlB
MKKILVLFLLTAVVSAPVFAGRSTEHSCEISGDVRLEMEVLSGTVEVRGWSNQEVQVSGTIGDGVESVSLDCDSRSGKVEVVTTFVNERRIKKGEVNLVVMIPFASQVRVEGLAADLSVDGVNGEIALETMSGELLLKGDARSVTLETMSGDVEIHGNYEAIEANAASGDILIQGTADSVEAETMSGDIRLELSALSEAELSTVSGSIQCDCDLAPNGRLEAEAVSGNVTLDLPDTIDATFRIESFNGKIESTLGGTTRRGEKTSKYAPGSELEFSTGSGSAEIEVSVFNGKCVIR